MYRSRALVSDMRPITPTLPAGDQIDSPRLVLRDGTVASIREVYGDGSGIDSPVSSTSSRPIRGASGSSPHAEPSDSLVERMADSSDPAPGALAHRPPLAIGRAFCPLRSRPTWPSARRSPRSRSRSTTLSREKAGDRCCSSVSRYEPPRTASRNSRRGDARRQHGDARSLSRLRLRDPIENDGWRRRASTVADAVG